MRQKQRADFVERNAQLVQTHGCPTPGVEQELLVTSFDKSGGTEALRNWDWVACTDQCHPEIAFRRLGRIVISGRNNQDRVPGRGV